jgi:hypothetical protein
VRNCADEADRENGLRRFLKMCVALALGFAAVPASALVYADRPAPVSQDDLDRLLAPVALHPDPLLAHILAASTYPAEVGEAVVFVEEHEGLRGQELAMEIRNKGWEPNVAALLQFPAVLAMMRDNPEWVRQLGDVFLREETTVLETVQTLRGLALGQGSLRTSREQNVYTSGDVVTIEPANARDICVPVYDPSTIYGAWWLPDTPPLRWRPKRQGPRVHDMLSAGISFAPCNTLAAASHASARPDWENRQLAVTRRGTTETWEHDRAHRRDVPYPTAAVRARFEPDGPGAGGGIRRGPAGSSGVTIIRPKADPQPEAER